jgi:predicted aldo/keto reductase-like oxidoreductase
MKYNPYGNTGIQVSALGFGGMRFEDPNNVDACADLVKACYDAGINYFDTAIGYGKSEELMGVAFKEMNATRKERPFYVASKTFGATEDDVRRDCETSLKRLQVDAIDFYHMWCIIEPQTWHERRAQGAIRGFEKLKEEGLIRHICISSHMQGSDIASVLKEYPFEGVLLGYSAMNFSLREAALAGAHQLNRAVVAMNPLGGGLIPQHPDRFDFVRTRPDETVVEGALRFLFSDPRITVALVGMANRQHLSDALAAINGFRPLTSDQIAHIRSSIREAFNEMCTGCAYCDDCPQGLPIPKLMDAYNQYILTGKPADMTNRLAWHWGLLKDGNRLDRCTECGACEQACTQKLPIIKRLKEIRAEVEHKLAEDARKQAAP